MEKHVELVMEKAGMAVGVAAASHIGSPTLIQNQDAHLQLALADDCLLVGVFDGHGPDLGQVASRAAKAFFSSAFRDPALLDEVLEAPEATLRRLFRECHEHLFRRFKSFYTSQGCIVRGEPGEYLMYRMPGPSQPFRCVYGGTTATLALLHNRRLIVASVGDSMALLTNPTDIKWHTSCTTALSPPEASNQTDNQDDEVAPFVFLTGSHAPDCVSEFNRLDRLGLGMQCMYDDATDPQDRVPIFKSPTDHMHDPATTNQSFHGQVLKDPPPRGGYVKNARNEWASVVSAPPHAAFPDSLAFTRSLGDFHMHTYGVTCEPDVVEVSVTPGSSLLLATDGVWDVWKFKQVVQYIHGGDCHARIQDFMHASAARGHELFGDQADNMTALLCTFQNS